MRRALPDVIAVVAMFAAVVGVAAPARAGESANACVNIRSAEMSTGLSFDVQNGCDKRLSCALTWTLTCENASGKTTSKAKQESRFVLSEADTHHTTGSAAACKESSWKIEDVSWDCAPVTK